MSRQDTADSNGDALWISLSGIMFPTTPLQGHVTLVKLADGWSSVEADFGVAGGVVSHASPSHFISCFITLLIEKNPPVES